MLFKAAELNKRILTDIEGIIDTESWFTDDAIFSRKIYELVKTDVHRMVLSGGALINTEADITSFVKQSMAKIMSPDSQFGYDKYTFTSFENPSDIGTNNSYEVRVRATDSATNVTDQTLTVNITNVDDTAPTITGPTSKSINENSTTVHTFSANENVTWSLNGGKDEKRFSINMSNIR